MSKLIGFVLILMSTAAIAGPGAKSPSDTSTKKHCLTFADDTGSHLVRTECRTKKEWKQLGVDVDELSANNGQGGGQA